ncbi:MAG: glycosyltransferase family 2 protein [Bacteroidia bacterium]
MSKETFFSIVIPTKNRPSYLRDAIRSVLAQGFTDYELIVSDNFNDENTAQVIAEFKAEPRLRSFRTDRELNMIDHWEFATQKASGRYVIVLPDRKLLYRDALQKLHRLIKGTKEQYNCISYGVKCYDDINKQMLWNPDTSNSKVLSSGELAENFLSKNYFTSESFDNYFPKTLNSCYKRSFGEEVRKKLGSYFNNQGVTTPDYSSFFINILLNEEILFSGFPFILSQGEHTSNGRNFGKGNIKSYMDSLGSIDPYEFVPVKAPFIYNLLVHDFMLVQHKLGMSRYKPEPLNYYYTNYYEYRFLKDKEPSNLYFLRELEKALEAESKETRERFTELKQASEELESDVPVIGIRNLHLHIRDYLKHNYSHIGVVNRVVRHRFSSAMQAAGFKE